MSLEQALKEWKTAYARWIGVNGWDQPMDSPACQALRLAEYELFNQLAIIPTGDPAAELPGITVAKMVLE